MQVPVNDTSVSAIYAFWPCRLHYLRTGLSSEVPVTVWFLVHEFCCPCGLVERLIKEICPLSDPL